MDGVELWSGRVGLPDWLGRSIMKGGREGVPNWRWVSRRVKWKGG